VFCHVYGQNYQAVYADRTASFINESNEIFFIEIRNVEQSGQDTVFTPFKGIQEIGVSNNYGMCWDPFGASWIGKQVVIRDDGSNVFLNHVGDSVFLLTTANPGDSWTAYQQPEGITVVATVSQIDVYEFLGIQDSVKTIVFQVYDDAMQPIGHHLNNRHLKLSKHHGLVRSMNFSLFPDYVYWTQQLMEADIAGMSQPMLGIQNLTWMQVHDFQPGDELHVTFDANMPWFYNEHSELIHRYIERVDFTDSVVYTVERQKYMIKTESGQQVFEEYLFDTITQTFTPDPEFDKLPGETVFDVDVLEMESAYVNSMHMLLWEEKRVASIDNWIQFLGDDCWGFSMIIDGCLSDYSYYKGLGGPYHYCNMWGEVERKLVYYKKGDEEWGNPLVIGLDELAEKRPAVAPNPANNEIRLMHLNQYPTIDFYLYDVNGRQLIMLPQHQTSTLIDLSGLSGGMYFYRIVHEGKTLHANKLLIQR
jgi:hypothetical protein